MALITLVDKIVNGIHNNEMTLGTFLDFSKAFDTIDHNIFRMKLNKYGIRGQEPQSGLHEVERIYIREGR